MWHKCGPEQDVDVDDSMLPSWEKQNVSTIYFVLLSFLAFPDGKILNLVALCIRRKTAETEKTQIRNDKSVRVQNGILYFTQPRWHLIDISIRLLFCEHRDSEKRGKSLSCKNALGFVTQLTIFAYMNQDCLCILYSLDTPFSTISGSSFHSFIRESEIRVSPRKAKAEKKLNE